LFGAAESEDFVPVAPVLAKDAPKNQWDDEDVEEEEVKQSWEEEDKPKPVSACKCPMRSIDRFRVSLFLLSMV